MFDAEFKIRAGISVLSPSFIISTFLKRYVCKCVSNDMKKQKFSSVVLHSKRWRHLHKHKIFIWFVWKVSWPVCSVFTVHNPHTHTHIQTCRFGFREFHLCVISRDRFMPISMFRSFRRRDKYWWAFRKKEKKLFNIETTMQMEAKSCNGTLHLWMTSNLMQMYAFVIELEEQSQMYRYFWHNNTRESQPTTDNRFEIKFEASFQYCKVQTEYYCVICDIWTLFHFTYAQRHIHTQIRMHSKHGRFGIINSQNIQNSDL